MHVKVLYKLLNNVYLSYKNIDSVIPKDFSNSKNFCNCVRVYSREQIQLLHWKLILYVEKVLLGLKNRSEYGQNYTQTYSFVSVRASCVIEIGAVLKVLSQVSSLLRCSCVPAFGFENSTWQDFRVLPFCFPSPRWIMSLSLSYFESSPLYIMEF